MTGKEIVQRAIEFKDPPRLPFFLGGFWNKRLSSIIKDFPNDVRDTWEMDRQENGWYFDKPTLDDWGCQWSTTSVNNMGQVVGHPLEDLDRLDSYRPPNPRNPFYFERINDEIKGGEDKYVVITTHFNLFERLHMLHGFSKTLEDFYMEPEKMSGMIDMILDFKLELLDEAARRFGDRINGVFMTDDWGTQSNTFVSPDVFKEFFMDRYKILFGAVHSHGWHAILHSCGKVNDFVPFFIEAGADVLNLQQPRAYGIKELGERFSGKVTFLTTVDIQATLPKNNPDEIGDEAKELVANWSKPAGGLIVFNYGDSKSIGVSDEMTEVMFKKFYELRNYWSK